MAVIKATSISHFTMIVQPLLILLLEAVHCCKRQFQENDGDGRTAKVRKVGDGDISTSNPTVPLNPIIPGLFLNLGMRPHQRPIPYMSEKRRKKQLKKEKKAQKKLKKKEKKRQKTQSGLEEFRQQQAPPAPTDVQAEALALAVKFMYSFVEAVQSQSEANAPCSVEYKDGSSSPATTSSKRSKSSSS